MNNPQKQQKLKICLQKEADHRETGERGNPRKDGKKLNYGKGLILIFFLMHEIISITILQTMAPKITFLLKSKDVFNTDHFPKLFF